MATALALSSFAAAQETVAIRPKAFDVEASEALAATRSACADRLEDAVEEADDYDEKAAVAALQAALRAAAHGLGTGSRFADRVRELSFEADYDRIDRGIEQLAADLRFVPLDESPMPVGFPPKAPIGEIVLKSYPGYRMARAPMRGGAQTGAFWQLFNHIKKADIAMTAPVQMDSDPGSEDARMPVSMAFLYREPDMGELGADGSVDVVDVPPHMAISIGVRGYRSNRQADDLTADLRAWLEQHAGEFTADGPVRSMGHNSPMVPASRQFWEVEIPVRRVPKPTSTAAR